MDYAQTIIAWYKQNKREMPWRNTSDPYKIWVSEVMLQQTQVETVKPYYLKFVERFPTIEALAKAEIEEVYTYWQGLGYYRRASNLHKGARLIAEKFEGKFPIEANEVKKIPSIGPYTLGAVLSIAFHLPYPAVDGNVMRILARQFLIEEDIALAKSRKVFEEKVMCLIPNDPNRFNQALMELGALICTPKSPKCEVCPMQKEHCEAYQEGVIEYYPVKSKKQKSQVLCYRVLLIQKEDSFWMEKRCDEGLLAGLWGFPMVEESKWLNYEKYIRQSEELAAVKHVFTHRVWEMKPVVIRYTDALRKAYPELFGQEGKFVNKQQSQEIPIGTAFKKVCKLVNFD